jgi:transmembrane sensor
MSSNNLRTTNAVKLPEGTIRQAIAWRIRLGSENVDDSDVLACDHWRQANDSHEQAWQRLERMEAPLQQAVKRTPGLSQSLLSQTLVQTDAHCRHISRRQALRTLGSSALSIAALGMLAQQQGLWQQLRGDFNSSAKRSQFTLSDSSQLWLNHHSSVEMDFNTKQRTLRLSRGEIHLASAADPRPLQVHLPQGLLHSQGSHFTVRHGNDYSLLQVAKGKVSVQHKDGGRIAQLQAGQVMRLYETGINPLKNPRFDYTSWVDGVLAVRNMPLKELLQEVARYRTGYVRCDPVLDNFLVSGVFQLHDTDLILQTLARSAASEVRYTTSWWANIIPEHQA